MTLIQRISAACVVILVACSPLHTAAGDMAKANKLYEAGKYSAAQVYYEEEGYNGNADAQRILGNYHFHGVGKAVDKPTAAYWYGLAGENGDQMAMLLLGLMNQSGDGIEASVEMARYWYAKAAKAGNAQGQKLLAQVTAQSPPIDTGNAKPDNFEPYEESISATLGSEFSLYSKKAAPAPAPNYAAGKAAYADCDYQKAYDIWHPLAVQGNIEAQNAMGDMYRLGQYVSASYEQAAKWYMPAANGGHTLAQLNLGLMFETGKGVAQSYENAATYYQLAVENNNDKARAYLGELYETGKGVKKNLRSAEFLYVAAASGGNTYAQERLSAMKKNQPSVSAATPNLNRKPLSSYPMVLPKAVPLDIAALQSIGDNCSNRTALYVDNPRLLGPEFLTELITDCSAAVAEIEYIQNKHQLHFASPSKDKLLDRARLRVGYLGALGTVYASYYQRLIDAGDPDPTNALLCNLKTQENDIMQTLGEAIDPGGEIKIATEAERKAVCRSHYPRYSRDEALINMAKVMYQETDGKYDKHIAQMLKIMALEGYQPAVDMLNSL